MCLPATIIVVSVLLMVSYSPSCYVLVHPLSSILLILLSCLVVVCVDVGDGLRCMTIVCSEYCCYASSFASSWLKVCMVVLSFCSRMMFIVDASGPVML